MPTLKPLRYTLSALSLLAGITSAQAALTIHFEEDVASGHLNITFSGQTTAPMNMPFPVFGNSTVFSNLALYTTGGASMTRYPTLTNLQGSLPWKNTYNTLISASGIGGVDTSHPAQPEFYSSTSNGQITWDASLTYLGNLAGIGLSDGSFGTIAFTNSAVSINWSATVIPVPEPATYAAVLGLGIASVALLRRRRAAR